MEFSVLRIFLILFNVILNILLIFKILHLSLVKLNIKLKHEKFNDRGRINYFQEDYEHGNFY